MTSYELRQKALEAIRNYDLSAIAWVEAWNTLIADVKNKESVYSKIA